MHDNRKVWQVSPPAGVTRGVAAFCLRYGVALLWPGDAGPWPNPLYPDNFAQNDWFKWFAQTMSVGDALLLRTGPSKISAVGIVASEYLYDRCFDDVHGFDLQHCRRIRWCSLPEDYDFGGPVFTKGRFSAVHNAAVRDYVQRLLASPPTAWQEGSLPNLPEEQPSLDKIDLNLSRLVAQAQDLTSLYGDRSLFGDPPAEDELIVHFVVPLLRELGWAPEQIAVKWRNIDVAVFTSLPRSPENCAFIIEAKRLGSGVEEALEQAKGYVQALGVPRDVVVTDGIRYRMYCCEKEFAPVGYANLIRLKLPAAALLELIKKR